MPSFPDTSPGLSAIVGSVYGSLAERAAAAVGAEQVYPFHVGDTWMDPVEDCQMQSLQTSEHAGLHRYTPPGGHPALIRAICARQSERMGLEVRPSEVLVTAGATAGLSTVVGALVSPGEEVLILAPHWPLIAGIVRTFHGRPVTVPFIGAVESPAQAVAAVEAARTPRTVALYLNTPNNPTSQVLPLSWLEALADWAAEHDLWLLADEVYEDYDYEGSHSYTRPLAPERTFSVHSFSKAYGMTGNRVGFVVGPAAAMPAVRKLGAHTVYSAPTAGQVAGTRALGGAADAWVDNARREYARVGRLAADRLGSERPQGGTFLFVDVAEALGADGLGGLLERCADAGVLVAPGSSFGPYPTHIRVCFTATDPDTTLRGIDVLAGVLGR